MHISSITLPMFDNAGASLASVHADLRRDLVEAFGGFSAMAIDGEWKDESTGITYAEPSTRYEVAADWTPRQLDTLRDLAESYRVASRQLAVMVTEPGSRGAYMVAAPEPAAEWQDDSAMESRHERDARKVQVKRDRRAQRALKHSFRYEAA